MPESLKDMNSGSFPKECLGPKNIPFESLLHTTIKTPESSTHSPEDGVFKTISGSSSVATIHFINPKKPFARKLIPGYAPKLRAQYEWLERRSEEAFIPNVFNLNMKHHLSSYDMECFLHHKTFAEIIHEENPNCILALENILDAMSKIHAKRSKQHSLSNLHYYQEQKLISKMAEVRSFFPIFFEPDEWVINTKRRKNFSWIKARLENKSILTKLSSYEECDIHGDLTAENILVGDSGDVVLIDPNNENYISSPPVDYAKLLQSLYCRYEDLCCLTEFSYQDKEISFSLPRNQMQELLLEKYRAHLSAENYLIAIFHTAIHFSRLMPYQIRKRPTQAPLFYATMLELFNEFFEYLDA